MGSSVEVTVQLRETDMCLLHTGFLCNTTEPVTMSPVWTGTGSSIINKVCFQCVVLQDRDNYLQASPGRPNKVLCTDSLCCPGTQEHVQQGTGPPSHSRSYDLKSLWDQKHNTRGWHVVLGAEGKALQRRLRL